MQDVTDRSPWIARDSTQRLTSFYTGNMNTRSSAAVVVSYLLVVLFGHHVDTHSEVHGGQVLDRDRRPVYDGGRVDTSGQRPLSSSRSNPPPASASSAAAAAASNEGDAADERDTIIADLQIPGVRTSLVRFLNYLGLPTFASFI